MKYHGIEHDSMLNGDGLREVLWVSGCNHHCKGCQNPQTHDPNNGLDFTDDTLSYLLDCLNKSWCSGLTLSGGDPLFPDNIETVTKIAKAVKDKYPQKTIWLYTGSEFDEICDLEILKYIDTIVTGEFVLELADVNFPWAGSTNQHVLRLKNGKPVNQYTVQLNNEERSDEENGHKTNQ